MLSPLPWRAQEHPNHSCCFQCGVCDAEGEHVADVVNRRDLAVILAAPALLAVVERYIDADTGIDDDLTKAARAAIALAQGG